MAKPPKTFALVPDFEGSKSMHRQGFLPIQHRYRTYLDDKGKKRKVMYLYLRGDYSTATDMTPKQYGLHVAPARYNHNKSRKRAV